MYKSMTTALVSQNATETTETEASTPITVPKGVKKLIGVGISLMPTGLTTLETVSGKLRLKSSDMTVNWAGDQEFLLPQQNPLTSGVAALNPYIYPTDIGVDPGGTIMPAVTMDMALTAALKWRVQLIFA